MVRGVEEILVCVKHYDSQGRGYFTVKISPLHLELVHRFHVAHRASIREGARDMDIVL